MNINGLIYLPIDATITENPFIYKLVPCQHFLQGICKKSDAVCKFSHGSLLPLSTYSQPQSYWYQVTLDPTTSKWAFESIPDTGSTQSSAISMATGLPLVNRKPQHTPSSLQFSGNSGAGVMEAASVGYPPMGRQRGKSSAYQGRAKARNTPATHPQPTSGKRRGKKQLASRQGNLPSQATDKHPAKSVDMPPDSDALVQSLDSMKIQSPDSDASSVSSWASLSCKLSTSKPIPAFSHINFPGLPGSENEDRKCFIISIARPCFLPY